MVILVLNCGSSSIKYQVIDMVSPRENSLLAKGLVERIGIEGGIITHKPTGKPRLELTTDIPNHTKGIDLIFKAITDSESGVIASLDDIRAVGHRVAHGGDFFDRSVLVDDEVINRIEQLVELAPLHNPANLKGIYAVKELCPAIPQVVCFDTSFHQSMPPRSYIYGLPYKYYEQYRVRRYGFHGTSHKFVAQKGCELAGLDFAKAKVVTCHIGNGASVAAVDPGALTYIADKEHMTGNEVWGMINKQAGVLGITGLSSDMRDIENAAAEGNERAKLALDVYYYRVKKYVGAYAAAMGGLDLVVFTGGVGENDPALREYVCSGMEFLGLEFDADVNRGLRGKDTILTKPASRVKAALIATNEELVIATDTFDIVEKLR